MTVHGSCLCGGIAWEVSRFVDHMYNCHCSRCRKAHGAAFVTFVHAEADDFRWVRGEDLISGYLNPENEFTRQFCKVCGGKVPSLYEGRAILHAGPLDDDPGLRPSVNIYVKSKAAFHEITDDLATYEPPEEEAS